MTRAKTVELGNPPGKRPGCGCGCRGNVPAAASLGAFDLTSFAGGLTLPLLLIGGLVAYALFFSPYAKDRKAAFAAERKRHQEAMRRIASEYPRIPR